MMSEAPILAVNTGSSSLKVGVYSGADSGPQLLFDALADGIGTQHGALVMRNNRGRTLRSAAKSVSLQAALREVFGWLAELVEKPCAIGHRIVHGGPRLLHHQRVTKELLDELQACLHFAPLHIPVSLSLIDEAKRAYPGVPQFACFDTAFHSTLPETAARFPLPRSLFDQGIRRYGFHGLSYESIVFQLGTELRGKTVIAHLGNGASLAALKDGQSVDTTMGLTPTGGIPMSTRSGDLDPGILLYLMRTMGTGADELEHLLNHDSGLGALSGGTSDIRDLTAASKAGSQEAQIALDIFCIAVAKTVAAYTSVLGGLEMLVFTGGIGEHSDLVRREVCERLHFLGIHLDESRNQSNSSTISTAASSAWVCIVPSQEDAQIARHSLNLMSGAQSSV
jgi:acetate kinase